MILARSIGSFLAVRIAIPFICTRWLGLDPQLGAATQIALGLLLFLLLCFHSLSSSAISLRKELRHRMVRWILIYLLFSLLSFTWSGAVSLPASFTYWCASATDVGTVLLLLNSQRLQERAHELLQGFVYAACTLATLAWMLPAQDDLRLGDLDYFNTNQIGNLCAFGIIFAQYLERSQSGRWPIAKALLAITLMRSLSKTTIIAMIVSQAVLFMRDDSISPRRRTYLLLGSVAAVAIFWDLLAAYFTIYTTTGNQVETLTGRTAIWAFALDAALIKPWFGNGFDSLWHVMPPFGPDHFEARHAENEILQQFFAYGVTGVTLLAGIYGSFYRQIIATREKPRRLLLYSLLIYVLIRGLAEAEPFDLLLPLWSIVLFSTLSARSPEEYQPKAVNPAPICDAAASVSPQDSLLR